MALYTSMINDFQLESHQWNCSGEQLTVKTAETCKKTRGSWKNTFGKCSAANISQLIQPFIREEL